MYSKNITQYEHNPSGSVVQRLQLCV